MKVKVAFIRILIILPAIALSACTGIVTYQIDLLPTPDVYAKKLVDPFSSEDMIKAAPYKGILYVTDRLPSTEKHDEIYYRNKRGIFLRLGIGAVEIDWQKWFVNKDSEWEELVKISTTKKRKQNYPLQEDNS